MIHLFYFLLILSEYPSFTNKCYIPTILFPNHLFSPEFTVLLQKVSN